MIPEKYRALIDYNPLAPMILSWRDLFMNNVINYNLVAEVYLYGIFSANWFIHV